MTLTDAIELYISRRQAASGRFRVAGNHASFFLSPLQRFFSSPNQTYPCIAVPLQTSHPTDNTASQIRRFEDVFRILGLARAIESISPPSTAKMCSYIRSIHLLSDCN